MMQGLTTCILIFIDHWMLLLVSSCLIRMDLLDALVFIFKIIVVIYLPNKQQDQMMVL